MGRIDLLFELEREQPSGSGYGSLLTKILRSKPKNNHAIQKPKKGSSSKEDEKKKEEKKEKKKEEKKEDKKEDRLPQPTDDHPTMMYWYSASTDHEAEIYKDYDLYLAAKNGNLVDFIQILDRVSNGSSLPDVLSRLSPAGNTFFHIAAKFGKEEILNFVAEQVPSLVLGKNFKGDTALHLAAKAGDESTVKGLVQLHQKLRANAEDEHNVLRAKNREGNTALHEALLNGRSSSIAKYLVEVDPELSYCRNNDGNSALYLAAEFGFVDCVSLILQLSTDEDRVKELFRRKSPIHAAIRHRHRGVLEAMLNMNQTLIQSRDERRRNPLHHAAFYGSLGLGRYLLNKCAHNATQRDEHGFFPIHLAVIEGHVDLVRLLLEDCPDPGELLDRNDCNILHLAVINGRSRVVDLILQNPGLENLINMKSRDGNTALHMAAAFFQPKIVSTLTWDKRVDINMTNNWGATALDAAAHFSPFPTQFTQILTWAALKAAGTPRYLQPKPAARPNKSILDNYKDIVNTLLLVATLVATVTFSAGFTVPGGYNSSESNIDTGMAAMLRDRGFHVFVFCDTIAMYSSIIVVVALIWAQLGDMTLVLNALTVAVPFLTVALSMMSMAFMAGVFIVVSRLRWLGTAVLVMGVAFVVLLFLLVLPMCTPLASRNRILRYLSYYPFCLLILVSSKCLGV